MLIQNPVRLGFDPETVMRLEAPAKLAAVEIWPSVSRLGCKSTSVEASIHNIFHRRVGRTLYLALVNYKLPDAFFNCKVLLAADDIRKTVQRAPRGRPIKFTARELQDHLQLVDFGAGSRCDRSKVIWITSSFCCELWPYLVWALKKEGLWKFIVPGNAVELQYEVDPVAAGEMPNPKGEEDYESKSIYIVK